MTTDVIFVMQRLGLITLNYLLQCLLLTTSSQYKVNYGLLHKNGFISEISQLTVFCFY